MESMDWRRVKPIQSWECSSCSSLYALHLNCMSCVSLNAIDESASLAVDKSVSNKKTFCNLAPDRFVWFSFAWTSLISSNEDETRLASSNVQRFRSTVLPSVKDISAPVRFEEVNCTSYKKAFFITILDRSLPRNCTFSILAPEKSNSGNFTLFISQSFRVASRRSIKQNARAAACGIWNESNTSEIDRGNSSKILSMISGAWLNKCLSRACAASKSLEFPSAKLGLNKASNSSRIAEENCVSHINRVSR